MVVPPPCAWWLAVKEDHHGNRGATRDFCNEQTLAYFTMKAIMFLTFAVLLFSKIYGQTNIYIPKPIELTTRDSSKLKNLDVKLIPTSDLEKLKSNGKNLRKKLNEIIRIPFEFSQKISGQQQYIIDSVFIKNNPNLPLTYKWYELNYIDIKYTNTIITQINYYYTWPGGTDGYDYVEIVELYNLNGTRKRKKIFKGRVSY